MSESVISCPACARSLGGVPSVSGRVECPGCGALCVLPEPPVRTGSSKPEPPPTTPPTPGARRPGPPVAAGALAPSPEDTADNTVDAFAPSGGQSFEPLPEGWVPPFTRQFLEQHQVMGLLGKGAMGAVYLMRQVKLDRLVAVKVVREDVLSTEEARRLEKEARVLASLNHPNILALYDVGTDAGKPYMVCEYVEGETLAKRISRKPPLTLVQTLRIILQVLDGLKTAHKKGVIHRDLKPGNILLSASAKPKIGDFGLAKAHAVSSGTLVGRIVGTPAYMSPEQCRGGSTTVSSDIYSIGCILFELAAGRRPFTGPDTIDYLTQHTTDAAPLIRTINPAVPEELERILVTALAKDPARRFDSARTFRRELLAFYKQLSPDAEIGVGPVAAPSVPLPVPVKKPGEMEAGTLLARRYRVQKLLGEGGMGQVWLAADEAMDGTEVALKILPGDLWRDPEARETLKQEAKLSQKLAHPNIVRLMTLEPGEPSFLVMEYISGPTLAADLAMRKRKDLGPYTPAEALPLIEGVASGLDHAHSKNLVHRDLKPSNVMLDPQPDGSFEAKLADFGIAAELTNYRTRQTGAVPAGTLAYMSPEQLACQKLDGRADVYSLGATLYQMLTLQPPYVGGDIAWAIRNEPVPEPAGVPQPVVAVLFAALAKDREDRPSTPGELAARLREAVRMLPPSRPGIGTALPFDPGQQPWAVEEEASSSGRTGQVRRRTLPEVQPPRPPDLRSGAPARLGLGPATVPSGAVAEPAPVARAVPVPWTLEAYALALIAAGGWIGLWLNAGYLTDGAAPGRIAAQIAMCAAAVLVPAAFLWSGSERARRTLFAAHGLQLFAAAPLYAMGRAELVPGNVLLGLAGLFLLGRPAARAYCTGLRPDDLDLRLHHRRSLALVIAPLFAVVGAFTLRTHLQAFVPERLPASVWVQDAQALGPRVSASDGSFSLQPPAGWAAKNAADGTVGFVYAVGGGAPVAALAVRKTRADATPGAADIAGASARLAQRRRRFHVEVDRAGVAFIDGHAWTEVSGRFQVQGGARAVRYLETVKGGLRYEVELYGITGFIAANRALWSNVLASMDLTAREDVAAAR